MGVGLLYGYAHRIPVHNFVGPLFCILFSLFQIDSSELYISWSGAVEGWRWDSWNKITNLITIILIFATRCQCRVFRSIVFILWRCAMNGEERKKINKWYAYQFRFKSSPTRIFLHFTFFTSLLSLCIFKRNRPCDTQIDAMIWNENSWKLWSILLSRKKNDEFQRKMISIFYGHSYSTCTLHSTLGPMDDALARKSLTHKTQTEYSILTKIKTYICKKYASLLCIQLDAWCARIGTFMVWWVLRNEWKSSALSVTAFVGLTTRTRRYSFVSENFACSVTHRPVADFVHSIVVSCEPHCTHRPTSILWTFSQKGLTKITAFRLHFKIIFVFYERLLFPFVTDIPCGTRDSL